MRGLHSTAAPLPLRQADLSAMGEVEGVRAIAGGATAAMQRTPYCAEPSRCCPRPGCSELHWSTGAASGSSPHIVVFTNTVMNLLMAGCYPGPTVEHTTQCALGRQVLGEVSLLLHDAIELIDVDLTITITVSLVNHVLELLLIDVLAPVQRDAGCEGRSCQCCHRRTA